MLQKVLTRFERQAPVSVMAGVALERAREPGWVDEVFENHRQRQYPGELLFSTVVELVSLAALHEQRYTTKSNVLSRRFCAHLCQAAPGVWSR